MMVLLVGMLLRLERPLVHGFLLSLLFAGGDLRRVLLLHLATVLLRAPAALGNSRGAVDRGRAGERSRARNS